jgi:acyl-CoA thioesterase-2
VVVTYFIERGGSTQLNKQMPIVPSPEALPTVQEIVDRLQSENRVSDEQKHNFVTRFLEFPFPVDVRRASDPFAEQMLLGKPRPAHELNWMRVHGTLESDDHFVHACGLCFLSDWSLLRVATVPHGLSPYNSSLSMASIDHAMWFHQNARADEWLLFEVNSTRAINGRGLSFGKFFTQSGNLVLSCAQEGVLRISKKQVKASSIPSPKL